MPFGDRYPIVFLGLMFSRFCTSCPLSHSAYAFSSVTSGGGARDLPLLVYQPGGTGKSIHVNKKCYPVF